MKAPAIALLAIAALVAGCLSGGDSDSVDYGAIERAIGAPVVEGHDHLDPSLHQGSYNLERTALLTGEEGRARQETEFFVETAVKGGYAYLCRTGPDQGLVVFDVADIERPKQVGYLKLEAGYEPDIEVSDDGHWGFWETQRFPLSIEVPSATDPLANSPRGIHIVDLTDKTAPRWAGFTPLLLDGPHSITYANIAGRHIVFANAYSYLYRDDFQNAHPPTMQRLVILELQASGSLAELKTLAEYRDPNAQAQIVGQGDLVPHDVSIQVHPLTGRAYAYLAYWDLGVVILDVSDPAHPVKVGETVDFGPATYRDIHMARPFPHLIAGRHVTVAEPEIAAEADSGYLTFIDTTDPAHPTYLSSWKLPGELTSEAGILGPHYFDTANGLVALASYHAGFWVIDVHDGENLLHPRSVGYALVNATRTGLAFPNRLDVFGPAPLAFDAWWADATHILGGDVYGGLAVYRYEGPLHLATPFTN
ncbi:MAG TPA: hypothetical protein VI796_00115 [Candidatus Thermoplasmatota archaeon]|nr:hypothetical protein [Candidatus Thermoplasmatota archaeon]